MTTLMTPRTEAPTGLTRAVEERVAYFAEHPITFETFLDLSHDIDAELVNGVMVERMAAQLEHEKLFAWLFTILNGYVMRKGLGMVLGSRTAIRINQFGARLPDLLFVRQDRLDIVQQKAIYGAPDLVIEILSPNDRPSDRIALETNYRSIGVAEIWFIDPIKQRVYIQRKTPTDYQEAELTTGNLSSETVSGFALQVEWLFTEPRPDALDTLMALLAQTSEA